MQDKLSKADCMRRVEEAKRHAVRVFGETGYALRWLNEPNEALGGAIPLKLLEGADGDDVVRAELRAIEHSLPV